MGVEVVQQRTSWFYAIVCWCLIRLFSGLARGRSPFSSSPAPHDATRTLPSHLERHYDVHIGHLVMEDDSSPLPPAPPLSPPPSARPSVEGDWTKSRHAWLAPLAISPHPPAHHPSEATEMPRSSSARAGIARSGAKRVVLFLHGSGFVQPMSAFHWKFASLLSVKLDALVVVRTYTLLPWGGIWDVLPPLLIVYRELQKATAELGLELIVLGDSAGGSLAAALTLAARDVGLPPPDQLVLVAPGLEACIPLAKAKEAAKQCAMLTATGMIVSRRHWAIGATDPEIFIHEITQVVPRASTGEEEAAAAHPYASPLRGDWSWLTTSQPGGKKTKVTLVSGTWDLSYPLSVVPFEHTLQSLGHEVEATVIVAPFAVHDYPVFVDTPLPLFVGAQQGFDLLVSSILAHGD